jgi:hypothetical protein
MHFSTLQKYGAYDLFNDKADEASKSFCEADIDQILVRLAANNERAHLDARMHTQTHTPSSPLTSYAYTHKHKTHIAVPASHLISEKTRDRAAHRWQQR